MFHKFLLESPALKKCEDILIKDLANTVNDFGEYLDVIVRKEHMERVSSNHRLVQFVSFEISTSLIPSDQIAT